jgi:hypothetical protein
MALDNTVFISYKSEDRELVKPYLKLLSDHGIKYWWDQEIDGKWGREIERALGEAKLVLGFVTENSMKSAPVFAEFRRAGEQDKLIPVRLDKAPYTYEFETVLALLNYFDLSPNVKYPDNGNPELQRLIERIKKRVATEDTSLELSERKVVKTVGYEAWFDEPEKLSLFPYVMSLCIFEGSIHEVIQHRSDRLQKELVDYGFSPEIFGFKKISKKSARLRTVGAEVQSFQSDHLPYPVEYIEFLDRDFKDQFLDYVWREMDQFKGALVQWFEVLLASDNGDENLKRVALALSVIGRKHFNSVFWSILFRWLKSNDPAQVDCADLALSLMTSDVAIFGFVKRSIDDLTSNLHSEFSFNIAMRLACGYTGISLPEVAIALMRRVEDAIVAKNSPLEKNERLVGSIQENVTRLALKANADDYALLALKNFLRNLLEWMNEPVDNRKSYLPSYISIYLFKSTESTVSAKSSLDLKKIFSDGEDIDMASVDCVAMIFNSILTETNTAYRDLANERLVAWCAHAFKLKEAGEDFEYVVAFIKRLHEISRTSNDKSRIAFAANKIITL